MIVLAVVVSLSVLFVKVKGLSVWFTHTKTSNMYDNIVRKKWLKIVCTKYRK